MRSSSSFSLCPAPSTKKMGQAPSVQRCLEVAGCKGGSEVGLIHPSPPEDLSISFLGGKEGCGPSWGCSNTSV